MTDITPDFAVEKRSAASVLRKLVSDGWLLGGLAVLVAIFAVASPTAFLTGFNITSILSAASLIVILAIGQTFVIATGGVDLSLGGVLVFSGVVSARVMVELGGADAGPGAIFIGVLVGAACGLAWGVLNGALVAIAGLPPLIVTLGTLGGALSLAQVITGGLDIREIPDSLVRTIGQSGIAGIPMMVVLAIVVAVVGGIIMNLFRFGVRTRAVGSNMEGARRAGIPVVSHLVRVYAFQGLLVGVAAVISLGRYNSTTISGHSNDALAAIAGVVLGGTSLFGGSAKILGTVIGVLIPVVLLNGLVIVGLPPFWQGVAVGVVLIGAVYIDRIKRRARRL